MPRSRGSVEFTRMPGTQVQKAERWGISPQSVSKYQRGETVPSLELRERIADSGGPDPDSWDEPVVREGVDNSALAPLGQLPKATAADTATEADLLLAKIRALSASPDLEGLEYSAKVRAMANLTAMVDKLGHHTGTKITERQILDAPAVVVVVDRLLEALEPWPEAMRAAASAILELKAKL